ncbi:MAG: TonB-dependent receptor [Chitinophagaceae bacterium]|nr:TonB-dependent receptor [Chitinophagaceae bacterium]
MACRYSYILFFILLGNISAYAQQTGEITGKVFTSDGQPVPGMNVTLKDTRFSGITNETGSFRIKAPGGSYTLVIESAVNQHETIAVSVKSGLVTDIPAITLRQNSKQLPEVVVTGQYAVQSLKNSVHKVRVIDQERIRMRNATDISGVLNTELGIRFSTDYALTETDVQIMGIGGQRVKILLDGIPINDRDDIRQSLGQIDINTIERIEIVEGPMSVIYGTDGLGGIINIITHKAKTHKAFGISARIQEESIGNTYSPFKKSGIHNENLTIHWSNLHWNASAYGTRNNFGGYTDTAAYPAKVSKPKDQWLAGGTLGYGTNNQNILYRLDYLNESIFAAGVMNINSGRGQDKYYITHRLNHQLQHNWQMSSALKLNTALSYQAYKRNTETYTVDYVQHTKTPSTAEAGSWDITKFNTFFFRSTLQWYISPLLSVQPGIDIKYDETTGERILDQKQSITDYSAFASAEIKPVSWLNIKPGIRFSKNTVYDAPPLIPSLNTKIALNKQWDIRASYGRGFRAPMLRELYFHYFDANHQIEGNPELKAEYSNSYMASINWNNSDATASSARFSSSLTGFYNNYFDFITTAMRDNSNVFSYFNIDKYKTAGVILDNKITYKNITATLGYAYIARYNQYQTEDKYTPEFTWASELNSNITYNISKLGASIGLYYKFTGALPSYRLNSSNQVYMAKTNSYHWADITASKKLLKYITLGAGIKNLFGVKWVGSTVESGGAHSVGGNILTGYGRSYFASIGVNWSK